MEFSTGKSCFIKSSNNNLGASIEQKLLSIRFLNMYFFEMLNFYEYVSISNPIYIKGFKG